MTDTGRSDAVPSPAVPAPATPAPGRPASPAAASPAVMPASPVQATGPAASPAITPEPDVPGSAALRQAPNAGPPVVPDARRDPLPGRVWGIVSLALAVLPLLQLVGLVAGIVGLVLSVRAGRRNWFAVAGILVSLLLIALAVTLIVSFAFSGYEVFGGSVGSTVTVCSELGPGEHVVDGLTYRCD